MSKADHDSTPFERLTEAMRRIVAVPKAEVERRIRAGRKRRRVAKRRNR